MYEVVLSREAQRALTAADAALAKKLGRCFAQVEVDPRSGNNIKRLTGPLAGYWRFRVKIAVWCARSTTRPTP